jgi:hypothetical protein
MGSHDPSTRAGFLSALVLYIFFDRLLDSAKRHPGEITLITLYASNCSAKILIAKSAYGLKH